MSKVWFVTGSSRGLGRQFVEAALSRGDKVAATARNSATLKDLVATYGDAVLPLDMDVTDRAAVFEGVRRAEEHFGRLDVVVNNAGYAPIGAVEELAEQQLRDVLETNVFGALRVVQAALPYLRRQGSGHIIQMSSMAGLFAAPLGGGYHASKWALEGLNDSLAQEVGEFGIKVTVVAPGGFATRRGGEKPDPLSDGDPAAAAQALLEIVDSANPPLRVFFGPQSYQIIQKVYADRLKTWADWQDLSVEARGKPEHDLGPTEV